MRPAPTACQSTLRPSPNCRPTLVLFDMDGVLFDTMPDHATSWQAAAEHYGIATKPEEFYLYEGQKGSETISHIYKRTFGEEPSPKLNREIYNYKTQLFNRQTNLSLIPGAEDLMCYLSQAGLQIGIVTGSSSHNAYRRIEKHYAPYIASMSHIVTADHVTYGKPHPEPYLKGMEIFGATPEETLVVENAPYGVRSASSSGAFVTAVTTGPIPSDVLYEEGADIVFADMAQLLSWCRELLQ